ncbi:hypothetical protein VTL71DRAFT_12081 [Oculimacula yallundae]|uniref:BTB domain-containing protein n=1 Tax=Oculimacula yallundae TaxID=86028 RepID=A0ABR4CRV0_9HELO
MTSTRMHSRSRFEKFRDRDPSLSSASSFTNSLEAQDFVLLNSRPRYLSAVVPNTMSSSIDRDLVLTDQKHAPTFGDTHTIVFFTVGRGTIKTFAIHKEAVSFHSPVFAAQFQGVQGRVDSYQTHLNMQLLTLIAYSPEMSVQTFKFFTQWCYGQKLVLEHIKLKPGHRVRRNAPTPLVTREEEAEAYALVQLWKFAGKYHIPRLQNAALHAINAVGKPAVPLYLFDEIYDKTKPGCTLRKYAVGMCVVSANTKFLTQNPDYLPKQMILDFGTAMMEYFRPDDGVFVPFSLDNYMVDENGEGEDDDDEDEDDGA